MMSRWLSEACDEFPDPESGAAITRFTTAVTNQCNIYCEQPYTTPDSKRIAIIRSANADPRIPPFDLWVADVQTLKIALIERNIASHFVGTAAWTGLIHYLSAERQLICADLATGERRVVLDQWDLPEHFAFQSVSPDQRYMVGCQATVDSRTQIIRLDMQSGEARVIFEHDEILGHLQFNPVHGREVLVQHNRGMRISDRGEVRYTENYEASTTHFFIDINGGNVRPLPVGPPHTATTTGHSNWVADTGRMAVNVHWQSGQSNVVSPLDVRCPDGNLIIAAPEDEEPTVFAAPEHRFNHLNVSRCGRYFVADSYLAGLPGPVPLVMGNLQTGKYRALVSDCRATCGGAASSHPHPYLTADNRNVIYNADPYHVPHVYAARVSDAFLASLET